LVNANGGGQHSQVLRWSVALGADLGGNATTVGASAHVVVLGMAERAGRRISFWKFTKYGPGRHRCNVCRTCGCATSGTPEQGPRDGRFPGCPRAEAIALRFDA
jgi:hypothetical protein